MAGGEQMDEMQPGQERWHRSEAGAVVLPPGRVVRHRSVRGAWLGYRGLPAAVQALGAAAAVLLVIATASVPPKTTSTASRPPVPAAAPAGLRPLGDAPTTVGSTTTTATTALVPPRVLAATTATVPPRTTPTTRLPKTT
jgi:hypothetical protein